MRPVRRQAEAAVDTPYGAAARTEPVPAPADPMERTSAAEEEHRQEVDYRPAEGGCSLAE